MPAEHLTLNQLAFDKCRVLVVGDFMIDEYLWGQVDRVSPEAPVPVVSITNEEYTLGGAGNVVNNLAALGAKVIPAGVVGTGTNGNLLLKRLHELGITTEGLIPEPGRPTTKKTRVIAANQHVLRIDRETKGSISDRTLNTLTEFIEGQIPAVDIILISDYGKGLLQQSLLSKITAAAKNFDKIAIADPKGLDYSKYRGVTMLTPNQKEAALASGIEITSEATLLEAGARIRQAAELPTLLITRGKDGMLLLQKDKPPYQIRSEARQVFDVSGAGDTVLAVLGLSIASGASYEDGAAIANTAAGIVVGKVGTATVSKSEIAAALNPHSQAYSHKFKSFDELVALARELKKKGRRIVLTNGCFDLLHTGHIQLFSASKQLGDILIVAIDDDASVTSLKGAERPVIKAKQRIRILSALDSIDYVTVFAAGELKHLIKAICPDVLAKGSNYTTEEVLGHDLVEELDGRVVLIPITEEISSTGIIGNIKNGNAA